jgi:hypothetical protein
MDVVTQIYKFKGIKHYFLQDFLITLVARGILEPKHTQSPISQKETPKLPTPCPPPQAKTTWDHKHMPQLLPKKPPQVKGPYPYPSSLIDTLGTQKRKTFWWLTRAQRNHLMKMYNGNIPPSNQGTQPPKAIPLITTTWPHKDAPAPTKKQAMVLLHNTRTLLPPTTQLTQILNKKRMPDLFTMVETHQTPNTIKAAKSKWKGSGYHLTTSSIPLKNPATGIAHLTPKWALGTSIVYPTASDNQFAGRLQDASWHISPHYTIQVITIYGFQRQKTATHILEQFSSKIIERIEEAHSKGRQILLMGDWNEIQNPLLDCSPPDPNRTTPQWLRAILHHPQVNLTDPWRTRIYME